MEPLSWEANWSRSYRELGEDQDSTPASQAIAARGTTVYPEDMHPKYKTIVSDADLPKQALPIGNMYLNLACLPS